MVFDPVVFASERSAGGGAVQMPVDHVLRRVLLQKGRDGGIGLGHGQRRKMEHDDERSFCRKRARFFQRHFQPDQLALEDLFIVGRAIGSGQEPAAAAADERAVQKQSVVLHGVHALRQRCAHLSDGGPPVIVVSAQNDLAAGKGADLMQMVLRVLQTHGPGKIARKQHNIIRTCRLEPAGADAFKMVFPMTAEDVHGLVASGQVQISD